MKDEQKIIEALWEHFSEKNKDILSECYLDAQMGLTPRAKIYWDEKLNDVVIERLEPEKP